MKTRCLLTNMTDALLHDMIAQEREHFSALEKRRAKAALLNESRDILAHCDRMQDKSLRMLSGLMAEKYRRESEQK